VSVVTRSPAETRALAGAIAARLRPGDVVVLAGGLGSGKTTFAQGAAAALGVDEPVVSPTFTIVREYDADVRIAHVDLYRLERVQELHDLGFDEIVDDDRVTLVEWGERAGAVLPSEHLEIVLEPAAGDTRRVRLVAHGEGWSARLAELDAVVADFEADA
jgi:tRNA threonylcarbamoyladenosine biosynthesis protein TsaE